MQRKFQILVRKIELWYVSDIGAVVNTTIMLHNMMVAQRINNDEYEECESFYAFGSSEVEERQRDDCVINEQEQHYVDRRMAEIDLHRRMYATTDADSQLLTDQQKAVLDSTRFQYAQRRWECLYDRTEHHRLRDACIEQLASNIS